MTFFYDMNSLGNRHIGRNLRLLIVNNGTGAEFRIYSNLASTIGDANQTFIAASGHYGNKSKNLIRHYSQDLGYEYLSASTKEEFLEMVKRFTEPELTDKSMIFEVFTTDKDESDGIFIMNHLATSAAGKTTEFAKGIIKSIAGESGISKVKKIFKK